MPAPTPATRPALSLLLALASQASAQPLAVEPVVVTGSASALRLQEAPMAISVVTADELRGAGPLVNLSEAMARVPGLVVNNRSNYAQDLQISARGFGARAAFGVRGLRLYADGIPATMPDGQGQVAHVDLAGAQRIEVLRGPFSALYGNSSGGVIAVFGAPPRERRIEAAADAARFGLRQLRLGFEAPLSGTGGGLDLRGSVSALELDGFRPQGAARRQLANLRLGWQDGPHSLVLRLSDHTQDAQDPLGLSREQFRADPRQTTAQALQFDTRKTVRQTQAGAAWRTRPEGDGPLAEFSAVVYNGTRGVTQWQAIAPGTQAPARHGGGLVDFDRDYRGGEARLGWRLGPAELVTGLAIEQQLDDRQGYENFTGTGSQQQLGVQGRLRRDELNRAQSRDGFAQLHWPLADHRLALTGGLRSGKVTLRTEDRFLANGNDSGALEFRYTNPVLGLRWSPRPALSLHASLARGFESPTLGELAYRPDGQAGFNSALKGQASRQVELGAKVRGPSLSLDAALFAAEVSDEIGVLSNSGGRATFRNIGRTRREGLEAALRWRASPSLSVQAAAAWLHAVVRDPFLACAGIPCTSPSVAVPAGRRIAGTQSASAWAEAAWRPPGLPGEWAVEWRAVGRSPVNDTNADFAGGYALVHLRWRHTLALGPQDGLELLLRIDNLFDRVHAGSLIVNDGNGRFFEPGPPRSGLVSLRWHHRW